jgi:hypothetical protein
VQRSHGVAGHPGLVGEHRDNLVGDRPPGEPLRPQLRDELNHLGRVDAGRRCRRTTTRLSRTPYIDVRSGDVSCWSEMPPMYGITWRWR